jgi:hypothetical protein
LRTWGEIPHLLGPLYDVIGTWGKILPQSLGPLSNVIDTYWGRDSVTVVIRKLYEIRKFVINCHFEVSSTLMQDFHAFVLVWFLDFLLLYVS